VSGSLPVFTLHRSVDVGAWDATGVPQLMHSRSHKNLRPWRAYKATMNIPVPAIALRESSQPL
jgi:hypothetical protein